MKIRLLKDVLVSPVEIGTSGSVHNLPEEKAKAFIRRKLGEAVVEKADAAPAAPADPNKRETKPAKDKPEPK